MISRLRAPTCGIDHLTVRCETDRDQAATFVLTGPDGTSREAEAARRVEDEGEFVQVGEFDGLAPATEYSLRAHCGGERSDKLAVGTLRRPGGERLFRFGILADPHCCDDQRSAQRLYGHSIFLMEKYLERIQEMGADFVLLPGDVVDDSDDAELLERVVGIIDELRIPYHVLAGNNDAPPDAFLEAFGLGQGYYSFDHGGVHFTCLLTINGAELGHWHRQREWLVEDIEDHSGRRTILVSHFPLARHPRLRNQGNSEVTNAIEICQYLRSHDHVRAAFAGHKNIPSLHQDGQLSHVVCPQVVQYDNAFNMVDVYSDALVNVLHEIDEMELMRRSRATMTEEDIALRYGPPDQRNFVVDF